MLCLYEDLVSKVCDVPSALFRFAKQEKSYFHNNLINSIRRLLNYTIELCPIIQTIMTSTPLKLYASYISPVALTSCMLLSSSVWQKNVLL